MSRRCVFWAPALLVALVLATSAASEPWKFSLNTNLSLSSNTYSDSWVGGEAGSISWVGNLVAGASKQYNPKMNHASTLKLGFGQTHVQNKETKKWAAPEKSSDLIDFETVLKFTLGGFVDPFVSARAVSQFLDGRDPAVDHYGNPADITETVGASRKIVGKELVTWDARLGVAARQLIDRYHRVDSVAVEQKITNDGGVELVTELKANNKEKWAQFASILRIYEAVFSSTAEEVKGLPIENDWKYPHVNFENSLTVTVAKYIMMNAYVQLLYDKEIHENARLKEVVGVGLTYTYSSK